jgi:hypothetical protein
VITAGMHLCMHDRSSGLRLQSSTTAHTGPPGCIEISEAIAPRITTLVNYTMVWVDSGVPLGNGFETMHAREYWSRSQAAAIFRVLA